MTEVSYWSIRLGFADGREEYLYCDSENAAMRELENILAGLENNDDQSIDEVELVEDLVLQNELN